MPARRPVDFDVNELIELYVVQGHSIVMLSQRYGHWGGVLRRILLDRGVQLRDKSAAGEVRHKREGLPVQQERQARGRATKLASGAGSIGLPVPMTKPELIHRARGRQAAQTSVGEGEDTVASWLAERGLNVGRQVAVDWYNLDLAVDRIAIEISRAPHHPTTRPNLRERTKHLVNRGWHVLYVWFCPIASRATIRHGWVVYSGSRALSESVADEIVTHVQRVRADPSAVSQYRVIRGDGEEATTLRRKSGEPSGATSPFHDLEWLYGRHHRAGGNA